LPRFFASFHFRHMPLTLAAIRHAAFDYAMPLPDTIADADY
jgi:hypothetical protein